MAEIKLVRIDDRLIHGQVMTAWIKKFPSQQILVIDDSIAKDQFMSSVLKMAAPTSVEVIVESVQDAGKRINAGVKKDTIVLAKNPITLLNLVNEGVKLDSINLGGMGISSERKTLFKNIAVSPAERDALKELKEKGIDIFIQIIPSEKRYVLNENLEVK